jgi:hypothetical protein
LDKDCELQKIAVFGSYLEANVNAQYTFLAGGLIGILVLVLTLFYEGVFDVFGGRLLGIIPFTIILVGVFYANTRILQAINNQQIKHLSLLFDLISKVEKEEPIPSLNELKKKVARKNKLQSPQKLSIKC